MSAVRSVNERLLFHGYGLAPVLRRREPCACGGVIEAEEGEEASAVSEHNRTERHRRWRFENGK